MTHTLSKTALTAEGTPEDPLALVGETVDGIYRIDSLVGEGGFGVVYRAYHLRFQHPVAVKCLKIPGSLDETTRRDFLRKFQEEGRLLFQLSQGSFEIVRSIALGDTVTPTGIWTPFVVLEWLEGQSLAELLAERRGSPSPSMPLAQAMAWLDKPARALAYAHRMHVAHRDIKPANFFVLRQMDERSRPVIKVLDFGIAKVVEHGSPTVAAKSKTSFASFTPQYAAPEQFNPTLGNTGPWTDVYSFALMMVEMLVGHPALQADNAYALMKKALSGENRPTPRALHVQVAASVEEVFARALRLDPRERYASMDAFWNELSTAVETASTKVQPKGRTVAIPSTQRSELPSRAGLAPAAPSGPAVLTRPAPLVTPPQQQWYPPTGPPQPFAPTGGPVGEAMNRPYPDGMPFVPPPENKSRGVLWLSAGILIGIVLVIIFSGVMCTTCMCVGSSL